ncbi:MAG: zinc-binding alcohol dehydrogenase [bacterium]|nr:zinc-binding alcohol dehydrogenase [bacterium]
MPRELIADKPGSTVLREYEEAPLNPDQVRAKTVYSAVKHGTEFRGFQANTLDASDRFDWEWRMHMRGQRQPETAFPKRLGNMYVAEVIEVGSDVTGVQLGDRIFGHASVRETHTVSGDKIEKIPEGVSWKALMYTDPASVAVNGIREGNIRLGDRVAVFGLGAIGLMAAQCAKVAGASWVAAIDPIERRCSAAEAHGADVVFDPREVDVGLEIKKITGKLGVDVAMETSGSAQAMYDALRCTRYQGTVVSTAYYNRPMEGLNFTGEWHRNRIRIIACRSASEPYPDYGWDIKRNDQLANDLLFAGKLKADNLLDPIVAFEDVAEAYLQMNEHPETAIKLGVDHSL